MVWLILFFSTNVVVAVMHSHKSSKVNKCHLTWLYKLLGQNMTGTAYFKKNVQSKLHLHVP
jgi:ABC-type sulfate transport system substrate-binding protein